MKRPNVYLPTISLKLWEGVGGLGMDVKGMGDGGWGNGVKADGGGG